MNAKHNEKHLLKFGEVIDLKQIDALEPTKQVLEMRDKFKGEEKESIKKVISVFRKKNDLNIFKRLRELKMGSLRQKRNCLKLKRRTPKLFPESRILVSCK